MAKKTYTPNISLKPISRGDDDEPGIRKSRKIQTMKGKHKLTPGFVLITAIVVLLLYVSLENIMKIGSNVAVTIAALFGFVALLGDLSLVQLNEYERAVILRYGKFSRVAGPGWVMIIPGVETFEVVDIRVKTLDLLGYETITKDNVRVYLDIVVYGKIVDPYKAILGVKDLNDAIVTFVMSVVRDVVGNLTIAEVIADVGKVNELLKEEKERIKKEWGVDLISIEIQEVKLPQNVQDSMHDLRSAEYQKQVVEQQAMGREIMINAIQKAASKLDTPSLSYLYLESLKKVAAGKATKLIFPMELTRLAESASKKYGMDKDNVLKDLIAAYKETMAKELETKKKGKK